jgi:PIN domain nuclease of toxin-antitoxin system
MKELLNKIPKVSLDASMDYLIDTCFFIWIFEHHKEKKFKKLLNNYRCGITSFNAEELIHVTHHIHDKLKQSERHFFHHESNLYFIEVPVHPGNWGEEHKFVSSVLPEIDTVEHDPSDAVILAAAIRTKADILTRDKHDMFNARLENFLNKYDIKVLNTFPS